MRFSLRTLLILVTLVCLNLGWALNWKRQREAFRIAHPGCEIHYLGFSGQSVEPITLWLFREKPADAWYESKMSNEDIDEAKRLFPESDIYKGP